MTVASPLAICCMPRATVRRPEPQTWLTPQAVAFSGMPALMAAWRAGFWPAPAVRTWPKITSSTSSGETPARSRAALIAMAPSSWAGTVLKAPPNEPTAVRAAPTMTMSSAAIDVLLWVARATLKPSDGHAHLRPTEAMKALGKVKSSACGSSARESASDLPVFVTEGVARSVALFCGDQGQIAVFVGGRKP